MFFFSAVIVFYLYKNLMTNFSAWNNTHLAPRFHASGVLTWFSWVLCLGLARAQTRRQPGLRCHQTSDWGRIRFHTSSGCRQKSVPCHLSIELKASVSCELLAREPPSAPRGLHGVSWGVITTQGSPTWILVSSKPRRDAEIVATSMYCNHVHSVTALCSIG